MGRPIVKKSIVRLNILLTMGFGICIGIVLLLYAIFFVTFKSFLYEVVFSIGCIVAGIIVGLVAFMITKLTILRVVTSVSGDLKEIANGERDFTKRIDFDSDDEVGKLVEYCNLAVAKLGTTKEIILQSKNKNSSLAPEMDTISLSLQSIVDNVSKIRETQMEQGYKVDIMENSLQVLDDSIVIVVSNVMEFFDQLDTLTNIVIIQSGAVDEVIANILRVLAEIGKSDSDREGLLDANGASLYATGSNLIESTLELAEKSKQNTARVRQHLAKIDDIAVNVNLIAINASIEAAHAGAAGRGFQVVASEIRRLSDLTNKLTREIQGVLNDIAEDTDRAIEAIGASRLTYNGILTNVSTATSGLYDAAGNIKTVTDEIKSNYKILGELLVGLKEKIESLKTNSGYCHLALKDLKDINAKVQTQTESIDLESMEIDSNNITMLGESCDWEKGLEDVEQRTSNYQNRKT